MSPGFFCPFRLIGVFIEGYEKFSMACLRWNLFQTEKTGMSNSRALITTGNLALPVGRNRAHADGAFFDFENGNYATGFAGVMREYETLASSDFSQKTT
jgi:hypothetical protein